MRNAFTLVVAMLVTVPASAQKGGSSTPPNQEVGYRVLNRSSSSLVLANEDGSNTSTVYTSPSPFRFDLGPRGSGNIAIVDARGPGSLAKLYLVGTSANSTGRLVGSTPIELTSARRLSDVDFSPDGRKIAYACCYDGTRETLAVYDLDTKTVTPWATAPYFWNISWFRNGGALAFSTKGPTEFYEVSSPGAAPKLLHRPRADGTGEVVLDSINRDPESLLVSYNDTAGWARIGIWSVTSGQFSETDLARTTVSFFGNLNCQDTKLAYLGQNNSSGGQVWYIRDLTTNSQRVFQKASNISLQFWGC